MKRIIVLTEDEYTKLKKYILDAMYDYQHTRGGDWRTVAESD